MRVIENEHPKLKLPEFQVDFKLSKHLDDDALLKHMNRSFSCGMIGRPGSGKTSLMTGLIQTPKKLKKVFNKIYVFMPKSSRASMKKDVFTDELPEDQLYEGVTFENLSEVYAKLLESTEEKQRSLLIFDDVQSYLKNSEVCINLLHIIANRRHLRTCIFILAQNYTKIPKKIREIFTDMFLYNVSKSEYVDIFEEHLNIPKADFQQAIDYYVKVKNEDEKNKTKSFIYINSTQDKLFVNWNELEFDH